MTFEHLKILKPFRQQKGDSEDEETFSFSSQEYGMLVKGVVHAVNVRTWYLVLGKLMMLITPTGRMQTDTDGLPINPCSSYTGMLRLEFSVLPSCLSRQYGMFVWGSHVRTTTGEDWRVVCSNYFSGEMNNVYSPHPNCISFTICLAFICPLKT